MKNKLSIITSSLIWVAHLSAQDFQISQDENTDIASNFVDVSNDETMQQIEDIQETTNGSDQSVVDEPSVSVSAATYAEAFLDENLEGGYNPEKKRMFLTSVVSATVKDPAISDNFLTIRNGLYTRAVLQAKAEIAEAMNGQMSARDFLEIPGTDIHATLNIQAVEAQRTAEASKRKLEAILVDLGEAKADSDAGVTFGDRFNAMMDGIIKKIDSSYNSNALDAQKKARFEREKAKYLQAEAEYAKLLQEASKLKGQIEESMTSSVSIMAEMPLSGATIVQSYESYNEDTEELEVAVVLGWSKVAEQAAHASLMGIPVVTKPRPNKLSLRDWLKTQDLGLISGPRSYTDGNGKRWTIGISAVSMEGSSSMKNKARLMAPLQAAKTAQMALLADIGTKKVAETLIQTKSAGLNKSITEAADSLEAAMNQQFENRDTSGTTVITRKTLINPISQREMHVVVCAVDPDLCQEAKTLVAESYAISQNVKARSQANQNFKEQLKKGDIPESAKKAVQLKPPPTKRLAPIQSTSSKKGVGAKSGVFGQEASASDLDDF